MDKVEQLRMELDRVEKELGDLRTLRYTTRIQDEELTQELKRIRDELRSNGASIF